MRLRSLATLLLLVAVLFAVGCGGPKDKVKNENEARPGRDKELYETAEKKLRKGKYDEARLLFNVVITTYPDSEYLPLAKLAIADSFYLEGGSSQLEQAIGGYKDFANYFPTHRLTCGVKLKIAQAHMRQMNAYNRDWTKAKQAEHQLLATLETCQTSEFKPQVEENLKQVQQVLGLHELDIARFYIHNRQAYKAAEGRLRDIVTKYPNFTYRDEALFDLGQTLIEQEQPEEAAQYFTELARDIPNSEFAGKAKEYLEKLGKPIPTPSNNNPAPPRPSMMGKAMLLVGRNDLTISKDGVLVSKSGEAEGDAKQQLQTPVEATGAAGSVKATSMRPASTPAATEAATSPAPNGTAAPNGDSVKTNGSGAQPPAVGSNEPQPNSPNGAGNGAQSAKPEDKTGKAKDDKKDGNKKEKKKKGLFGRIFR